MNYQDTLLTKPEWLAIKKKHGKQVDEESLLDKLLEAQAEKSFRAGVEAGRTEIVSLVEQNNLIRRFTDEGMDNPEYWDIWNKQLSELPFGDTYIHKYSELEVQSGDQRSIHSRNSKGNMFIL